jgi:membrane fusion protein (multidrug efflux system)
MSDELPPNGAHKELPRAAVGFGKTDARPTGEPVPAAAGADPSARAPGTGQGLEPAIDEPSINEPASQDAMKAAPRSSAQVAARLERAIATGPAGAGQAALADSLATPARKLAETAQDLATAAKGLAVATSHNPSPQGERHLSGPRVITGEVMPPRRSRRRMVLTALVLAALSVGGYYGFAWWTAGRFIVSTDDAYIAADMSILAAKVPGLVSAVSVTDNELVRAGTLLVSIDDGDYKLAVDAAANRLETQDATIARIARQVDAQAAAIDQAKAQLATAQAELVRAQAAFDRAQKLAANDFGTKAALDQARADRDKAVAGIAAARSGLDQANAMLDVLRAQKVEAVRSRAELVTVLDRAKRDLDFTKIRAPFDGVVGNRAVEVGQYVQAGTRVLALVPLDTARVEANLKETQLAGVKPGQPVDVRVDAFGDRVITGRVESLSPASGSLFSLLPPENATGNFTKIVQRLTVRIALPAEIVREGILRPGMSVVVGINTREPGSHVAGEDLPRRFALLIGRARSAAQRMLDSLAAAKSNASEANASEANSSEPSASGEAGKLASPLR